MDEREPRDNVLANDFFQPGVRAEVVSNRDVCVISTPAVSDQQARLWGMTIIGSALASHRPPPGLSTVGQLRRATRFSVVRALFKLKNIPE
jgi:hypothetical protein